MSELIQSETVKKIFENERTFTDRNTGQPVTKLSYNVKLSSGVSVGFGFNKPNFEEGAIITLMAEKKGNFLNVIKGTVKVEAGSSPSPEKPTKSYSGSTGSASGSNKGGTNWDAKDKKAALGFAREQAIKTIHELSALKLVKLANQDEFLSLMDSLTGRFVEQANIFVETGIVQSSPVLPSDKDKGNKAPTLEEDAEDIPFEGDDVDF